MYWQAEVLSGVKQLASMIDSAVSEENSDTSEWEAIKTQNQYQGQCQPQPAVYADNMCFADAQNTYHTFINCLFNEAISTMENNIYNPAGLNGKDQSVAKTQDQTCDLRSVIDEILQTTVSADLDQESHEPFGLALLATDEYQRYRQYLDQVSLEPIPVLNCQGENQSYDLDSFYNQKSQLLANIETEKIQAREALDLSLIAYNEMRFSYPHHKQYECLINHLKYYRNQFANLRALTNCLPRFKKSRTSQE